VLIILYDTVKYVTGERSNPFSADLVPCLRVQYAENVEELLVLKEARDRPLSAPSEAIVASVLTGALQGMMAQYGTTLSEDQQRWEQLGLNNVVGEDTCKVVSTGERGGGSDDGEHKEEASAKAVSFIPPHEREKNAFILCFFEKKILEEALLWIDTHCDNLTPSVVA
jgi:hypothetical protein